MKRTRYKIKVTPIRRDQWQWSVYIKKELRTHGVTDSKSDGLAAAKSYCDNEANRKAESEQWYQRQRKNTLQTSYSPRSK